MCVRGEVFLWMSQGLSLVLPMQMFSSWILQLDQVFPHCPLAYISSFGAESSAEKKRGKVAAREKFPVEHSDYRQDPIRPIPTISTC